MPFVTSSFLLLVRNAVVTSSDTIVTSSFLLLVAMPGATRSVLAPSSDALCY